MTGVSYMIPFVAAGGILIALGFMLAQVAVGEQGAASVYVEALSEDGRVLARLGSPEQPRQFSATLAQP